LTTEACCSEYDTCIDKDNKCIATGVAGYLGDDQDGNDWVARCGFGGSSNKKIWVDCDHDSTRCGHCNLVTAEPLKFLNSGDGSIGEYGQTTDGGVGTGLVTECCGDDEGEFSVLSTADDIADYSGSLEACCNIDTDCVDSDTCVATGVGVDLIGSSVDDDEGYCVDTEWIDCDDSATSCAACDVAGNYINCTGAEC